MVKDLEGVNVANVALVAKVAVVSEESGMQQSSAHSWSIVDCYTLNVTLPAAVTLHKLASQAALSHQCYTCNTCYSYFWGEWLGIP